MDPSVAAQNRGPDMVIVTTVFLALSIFLVALRCFVRLFITKSFQADDWFILVATLNFILLGAFAYAGVHYGMGMHNKALTEYNEIQALKYQALATTLYVSNMAFVKLSIGFFLLRIAVQRRYIYTLKISMVILSIWTTGIFLFTIFQCKPVEAQWDFTLQNSKCVSAPEFVKAAYAFSTLAIITDWLYALMPIPMVWGVRMSLRAKSVVVGVLSLGIFASVATLIRARYLTQLEALDDLLYSATDSFIWSVIEVGISITAASVVTMRPLLRAMRIEGFGSTRDTAYPSRTTENIGPYSNELSDLPTSNITKDISMEYTISPIDRLSETGSEEDILYARNATTSRAWSANAKEET